MAGNPDVRRTIEAEISELLVQEGHEVPAFSDDLVLLESGLDSLGFAVLVTRLEENLGYDPFTELDDPVYPQTLGEFVGVYADHAAVS